MLQCFFFHRYSVFQGTKHSLSVCRRAYQATGDRSTGAEIVGPCVTEFATVGYPRDGGGVVRLATPDWPQKIGVDVIRDDIMCRLRPRLDPQKPPKNQIFHYIETLNVANNPCMEY